MGKPTLVRGRHVGVSPVSTVFVVLGLWVLVPDFPRLVPDPCLPVPVFVVLLSTEGRDRGTRNNWTLLEMGK